jgi:hypothetical protein
MTPMNSTVAKTEILIEALPWISRYEGKTFVIKYAAAEMVDAGLDSPVS